MALKRSHDSDAHEPLRSPYKRLKRDDAAADVVVDENVYNSHEPGSGSRHDARYPPFEALKASEERCALIYKIGEIERELSVPARVDKQANTNTAIDNFAAEEIVAGDWVSHAKSGSPHQSPAFYFAKCSKQFRVTLSYHAFRYRFSIPAWAVSRALIAIDTTSNTVVLSLTRDSSKPASLRFETSEPGTFASWQETKADWSEHGAISSKDKLTVSISTNARDDREMRKVVMSIVGALEGTQCQIGVGTFDSRERGRSCEAVKNALAHELPFLNRDRVVHQPTFDLSSHDSRNKEKEDGNGLVTVYDVGGTALIFTSTDHCRRQVDSTYERSPAPQLLSPPLIRASVSPALNNARDEYGRILRDSYRPSSQAHYDRASSSPVMMRQPQQQQAQYRNDNNLRSSYRPPSTYQPALYRPPLAPLRPW